MLEQDYDFFLADTDAGKSIHFNLRYQIYCLRERFEDPNRYPNFLEQDEYDDSSAHFIARCRNSGEWLGAMRLIIAPALHLPMAKISTIEPENFAQPAWSKVAEASRLCTLLPSSSRASFSATGSKSARRRERSQSFATRALQASWIAVGLIRAARQYCLRNEITYCFFLISDPLARMLRRLGMEIEAVGSPCQHRGWRSPYIHNVESGYQAMSVRSPDLYQSFCRPDAYAHFSERDEGLGSAPIAAIG